MAILPSWVRHGRSKRFTKIRLQYRKNRTYFALAVTTKDQVVTLRSADTTGNAGLSFDAILERYLVRQVISVQTLTSNMQYSIPA